jgi:hypothetical protein
MEHGKLYENPAIAAFEKQTGKIVMPFDFFKLKLRRDGGNNGGYVVVSPDDPVFDIEAAYSPDGFTTDGEMIEAKAPYSLHLGSRQIRPGFIPFHYHLGQIQYGMWLISYLTEKPVETTYYMEYRPPPGFSFPELEALAITKTTRDPDWTTPHVWLLDEFSHEIVAYRENGGTTIPAHYAGTKKQWEVYNHNRRIHESSNRVWPKSLKALETQDEIENPLYAKKKRPAAAASRKRKGVDVSIEGDDNGDAADISWDAAAWGMGGRGGGGGGGGAGAGGGGGSSGIDSMVTW